MMTHARIDDDGFVIALLNGVLLPNLEQQSGVVPAPPGDTPGGHAWRFDDDLGWQAWPVRPSVHHVFDRLTKQWIDQRTLADFKAAKWAQIKRDRDEAEFGGFTWNGSLFDSDAISQSRIQGAVQLASIALANNQTVVQEWTTADNSVVPLNATDLLNLGLQLGLFINKVHDYGRVLRARIDAADSSLDVQEVLWDEAEFNATLQ